MCGMKVGLSEKILDPNMMDGKLWMQLHKREAKVGKPYITFLS